MNTLIDGMDNSGRGKYPHHEVMNELTNMHEPIKELIGRSSVQYIDLPVYGNIGDLLIMLGTLKFFERNGIKTRLKAAFFNYDPSWASGRDVIVFQGGGNFGDLYSGPQKIREAVISVAMRSRIIILPQTIHFRSAANAERCIQILSRHPDLHIFTRDQRSFSLAQKMSRNSYLAPDMAHHLWRAEGFMPRALSARHGKLGLIRTDEESNRPDVDGISQRTDWPQLVGKSRSLFIRCAHHAVRILHDLKLNRPLLASEMDLWVRYAHILAMQAVDLLGSKEEIITDRLHGHILSCLLDVPNKVIDNDYGKNSTYINQWTVRSDIVNMVGRQ